MRKLLYGLLPLALLAALVVLFLTSGAPLPFGSSILVGDDQDRVSLGHR
jgi:hypothetical protein